MMLRSEGRGLAGMWAKCILSGGQGDSPICNAMQPSTKHNPHLPA